MKAPERATLVLAEACERFAHFGLLSILALYLTASTATGGSGWATGDALKLVGTYSAGIYAVSVVGGWLADRVIGTGRGVKAGSIAMVTGHAILVSSQFFHAFGRWIDPQTMLYVGLSLIVLGTGLFKPNVTVLFGQAFPAEGVARERGFLLFYVGINFGSMLGPILAGGLGERVAWGWGFVAAGSASLITCLALAIPGRRAIPVSSATIAQEAGGGSWRDVASRYRVLLAMALASVLFWTALEQSAGLLSLYAYHHTDRFLLGFEVPATWMQSLEPLLVLAVAPAVAGLWLYLDRTGRVPGVGTRAAIGLFSLTFAFVLFVGATMERDAVGKSSLAWLVAGYLSIATAEVLIWTMSLSMVTKIAPPARSGQVMGAWYLTYALGAFLAGRIGAEVDSWGDRVVFGVIAALTGGAALLYLLARRRMAVWERRALSL